MVRIATVLALLLSVIGARPVTAAGPDEPADAICRAAETATGTRAEVGQVAQHAVARCVTDEPSAVAHLAPVVDHPTFRHHREGGGGPRAP